MAGGGRELSNQRRSNKPVTDSRAWQLHTCRPLRAQWKFARLFEIRITARLSWSRRGRSGAPAPQPRFTDKFLILTGCERGSFIRVHFNPPSIKFYLDTWSTWRVNFYLTCVKLYAYFFKNVNTNKILRAFCHIDVFVKDSFIDKDLLISYFENFYHAFLFLHSVVNQIYDCTRWQLRYSECLFMLMVIYLNLKQTTKEKQTKN